jgi:hypothetical protein
LFAGFFFLLLNSVLLFLFPTTFLLILHTVHPLRKHTPISLWTSKLMGVFSRYILVSCTLISLAQHERNMLCCWVTYPNFLNLHIMLHYLTLMCWHCFIVILHNCNEDYQPGFGTISERHSLRMTHLPIEELFEPMMSSPLIFQIYNTRKS